MFEGLKNQMVVVAYTQVSRTNRFFHAHLSWDPILDALVYLESYLLRYTEYLPPHYMDKIQVSKVKRILASACNTEYWKDKIPPDFKIKTMSDLQSLPILTRKDIQENFSKHTMVNESVASWRRVQGRTSGSTGEPLLFYKDAVAPNRKVQFQRAISWLSDENAIYIRYAGSQDDRKVSRFEKTRSLHFATPSSDITVSVPAFYEFLQTNIPPSTPLVISIAPSSAVYFVRFLQNNNLIGTLDIKGIVCGGEALLRNEREYIEETLSCEVIQIYATQEFGIFGQECRYHSDATIHFFSEYVHVEILDEGGLPVPLGKMGKVVLTFFENEVMPFIRYETGDLGAFALDVCECGRTLPRLVLEGRSAALIRLPNGKTHTQFSLHYIFYDPRLIRYVDQYQIVHETPEHINVFVVLSTPSKEAAGALGLLQSLLTEKFENYIQITITEVSEIKRSDSGKRRSYIANF